MEEKKRENIYLEKPSKAEGGKQPTCVEINLKIGWLFNSPSFKWHYTAYTWSFSCMTVCGYRMCGNRFKLYFILLENNIYTARTRLVWSDESSLVVVVVVFTKYLPDS